MRDLLDQTKFRNTTFEINPVRFSLMESINSIIEIFQQQVQNTDVGIKFETFNVGKDEEVKTDEIRV